MESGCSTVVRRSDGTNSVVTPLLFSDVCARYVFYVEPYPSLAPSTFFVASLLMMTFRTEPLR